MERDNFSKIPLAKWEKSLYNEKPTTEYAGVMELVDVLDSKSSAARRAGSSPATGTTASGQSPPRSKIPPNGRDFFTSLPCPSFPHES